MQSCKPTVRIQPLMVVALAAALAVGACGSNRTEGETVPPSQTPPPPGTLAATEPREIRLGNAPVTVTLAVPSRVVPSTGSLWLVVEDLRQLRRGAYYQVYLNLPEGQAPDPAGPHFVGNISLYGMERGSEEGADQAFDVTAKLRDLSASGSWPEELHVTFVRGNPGRDASPGEELVSFRRILLEGR